MLNSLTSVFFRIAANGVIPASWFLKDIPSNRDTKTGRLKIEIVSHCWQYAHFLIYQLSSIVNYPPTKVDLTVTIFYCEEDIKTKNALNFFQEYKIPNVIWNWQHLPKERLFRRAIGRNIAAKNTSSDWIWFTDCDTIFYAGCLDGLADQLQNRNDILVYPKYEKTTDLLAEDDPILLEASKELQIMDVDVTKFTVHQLSRATGPFQITHGEIARQCGYCQNIKYYQKPAKSWCKAYEDKAYRWLLKTDGVAINIDNVFRIRHVFKGRYKKDSLWTMLRQFIRKLNFGYK